MASGALQRAAGAERRVLTVVDGAAIDAVPADLAGLLEAVLRRSGRVDILVNGAGINSPTPFLDISEEEFDQVFERITARGIAYRPEPWPGHEGQINHNDGGRGFYFSDPSGHLLEVLTRPYGSGGR